jgi:phenylalanyl-tRNA synthetase alpha chain
MSDLRPSPEAVAALVARFDAELGQAKTPRDAQAVRDRYLGRKNSVVASWMQLVGAAPADEKKSIGRYANELKQAIDARWTAYAEEARDAAPAGAVAVTLPGRAPRLGHRHPLTIVRDRLDDIFGRMGFAVVEGPEAEDEWHCFDALNMPAAHPARDMQDTLYLASPLRGAGGENDLRTLLRTHTSWMQIRYMQTHQPPVRIVAPGRVFRRDDLDVTHSPAFSQIELLAVDEGLSLADLKGTLLAFAHQMFSPSSRIRFRPSFFLHRAERGNRLELLAVRRRRLRDVQEDWLDRAGRLRHGPPGGVRGRRLRPRALHRIRLGHRHRTRRDPALSGRGHPVVLRERPPVPRTVSLLTEPSVCD